MKIKCWKDGHDSPFILSIFQHKHKHNTNNKYFNKIQGSSQVANWKREKKKKLKERKKEREEENKREQEIEKKSIKTRIRKVSHKSLCFKLRGGHHSTASWIINYEYKKKSSKATG